MKKLDTNIRALLQCDTCKRDTFHTFAYGRRVRDDVDLIYKCGVCGACRKWGVLELMYKDNVPDNYIKDVNVV